MWLRKRAGGPGFPAAVCLVLAAALAACGGPRPAAGAPAAAATPTAVDRVADRADPGAPAGGAPAPATPAPGTPAPAVHRDAFEVGGTLVAVAGTYRDCSGRAPVGMGGAYFEPCMGFPYWIGHHVILAAILRSDALTYWDAGGAAHRWHVIGRRVLRAGASYPGRLPGAVAELQTCLEASDTSPVEIVDYAAA
jgi:hypothetical protein